MRNHREQGIALITTLMILLLMSTMMIGLAWLVMGDKKLGSNNSDRQRAFYGAESGLEVLTASLENTFDSNYAPTSSNISSLVSGVPLNLVPGVQYLQPGSTTNGTGLSITFPQDGNGNPQSSYHTISSAPYTGLIGLTTPYTLSATAHTIYGSEVKLVRQVQTVAIPVFQFGIFSQTDLSFFAGPNFDFGGRVHTNGNLWLAEGNNNTLTMENKVTVAGQVITANLENGWLTSSNYTGAVDITTNPGSGSYQDLTQQSPAQSVLGTTNWVNHLGGTDSTFPSMASSVYNGNIATGVTPLNLAIATPAIGGQSIDIIRRPVNGEDTANPGKLAERYYSQVSLRVLLSDYGSDGTCANSDISSTSTSTLKLPSLSPNGSSPTTPIDLASLAWTSTGPPAGNANTTLPYSAAPSWLPTTSPGGVGYQIFPLPTSNAQGGTTYSTADGYWMKQWYPIITGCIKIDYNSKTSPGTWVDITAEILKLGWTGRNINPQIGANGVPSLPANPWLQAGLPTSQVNASGPTANSGVSTVGCTDPSPNAVIRLARIRDNPSNAAGGNSSNSNNFCGNNPSSNVWSGLSANQSSKTCTSSSTDIPRDCPTTRGTDFWPNALYDTREGVVQDAALTGNAVTLGGTMYYVELDAANLAKWFAGTLGTNGTNVLATTGYSVYFSDRRGEQWDPNPPPSVGATTTLTGGYGYDDFVNPLNASGCPNGTLDQGEDVESDYVNGASTNGLTTPKTYGGTPTFDNITTNPTTVVKLSTSFTTNSPTSALAVNPNCSGTIATPLAIANDPQDLRENPGLLFRRALKLVNGSTISIGSTTCNAVPCGLTVVAENPAYIQGDYNNPGLNTGFTGTGVGTSVIADAVTLLSNNWNDVNSFAFPYNLNNRTASDTTYRVAIVGGKGVPFKQPTGPASPPQDFGTDGGTHNFLRYLESWNNLYYEGSIVSMYYNHQAVGTYKCCTTVYNPPNRFYNFDTNFLTPSELPPLTPMLRALNTLTFTQDVLPTQ